MPPLTEVAPIKRRRALQLLASGAAATLASCSRQAKDIVPYVRMPERLVPGEAMHFATTLPLSGYGRGVVGVTHEGRPTKLEGNPLHPASLGGTDVFIEAEILNLYDPARSRAPRGPTPVESWERFAQAFSAAISAAGGKDALRLRILSGRITSPTFLRQMKVLLRQFPNTAWHRYEAVDDDNETQGLRAAFGKPLLARPRLEDAAVVLTFGADPLGPGPEQPRYARRYAERRHPRQSAEMLRLYACESNFTLTGANADHRLALAPEPLSRFAWAVAARLGLQAERLDSGATRRATVIADDLQTHRGEAVVLAGGRQPPEVHALAAWLNARIDAPVDYIEPIDPVLETHHRSLEALKADLAAGAVDALIVIDANPAYDSADDFAPLIRQARFSAHLGLWADETAAACQWHLPMSHPLESWSDLRAPDGTASIMQPLISPLYASHTPHALLGILMDGVASRGRDLVRETWREHADGDFDTWWRDVLEKGVIADTAAANQSVGAAQVPGRQAELPRGLALVVSPDPSVWDGRYANNAWLQECPKPLTKEVWGNAIALSEWQAGELGLADGDTVRLSVDGKFFDGPVRLIPGLADGVAAVDLGYGRTRAGPIGDGVGFSVIPLLGRQGPTTVTPLGRDAAMHTTFGHALIDAGDERLYPRLSIADLAAGHAVPQPDDRPSLLPPSRGDNDDGYAWGMVIDNALCIGCNACVVACQAENNVPVVGPEEIDRHREMHWLRIDAYIASDPTGPRVGFEPCPACIARKRPASRCARSKPLFTTTKDSTSRSTTAASARASARPTVRIRSAASTGSTMPATKPTPT